MRWINRSQSSFSEIIFSVFISGYFLFHHSPLCTSKYHFANSTKTVLANGFLRENCNSVWWIHRKQRSFSENFFAVLNWVYFLFHHSTLWASKYHFANSTKQAEQKASWWKSCNFVRKINRTQSSFSESFFPVLNGRYFLFHHSPLWVSKYHFANSTRTVLAIGFLRGMLELCEMN